MLGRFAPAGNAGAGASVVGPLAAGGGGFGGVPVCAGGALPEIGIAGFACRQHLRIDLRQRFAGTAWLRTALHDGSDTIDLETFARPSPALRKAGLLARGHDLSARPGRRGGLRHRGRSKCNHQLAKGCNSHRCYPHGHRSSSNAGRNMSRGTVAPSDRPHAHRRIIVFGGLLVSNACHSESGGMQCRHHSFGLKNGM
jgi:hypothetical protein